MGVETAVFKDGAADIDIDAHLKTAEADTASLQQSQAGQITQAVSKKDGAEETHTDAVNNTQKNKLAAETQTNSNVQSAQTTQKQQASQKKGVADRTRNIAPVNRPTATSDTFAQATSTPVTTQAPATSKTQQLTAAYNQNVTQANSNVAADSRGQNANVFVGQPKGVTDSISRSRKTSIDSRANNNDVVQPTLEAVSNAQYTQNVSVSGKGSTNNTVDTNGNKKREVAANSYIEKAVNAQNKYVDSVSASMDNHIDASIKTSEARKSWYTSDGSQNFPPNDGAVLGTKEMVDLEPGKRLCRYGGYSKKSDYLAEIGTSSDSLSLPPGTDISKYDEFELIKPIPKAIKSLAEPWGGSTGWGTQYKTPMKIVDLRNLGYIKVRGKD